MSISTHRQLSLIRQFKELDTRKLFSLWLKERMKSGEKVDLDYERFRSIVRQVVETDFPDLAHDRRSLFGFDGGFQRRQ